MRLRDKLLLAKIMHGIFPALLGGVIILAGLGGGVGGGPGPG